MLIWYLEISLMPGEGGGGAFPESHINRHSKKTQRAGGEFWQRNSLCLGFIFLPNPRGWVLIGPNCANSLNFLPLQLKNETDHIGMKPIGMIRTAVFDIARIKK